MKQVPAHLARAINHTIQSDSRIRVEQVLRSATRPLSALEVSELSGISISITRTHLGNAVNKGRAHNLNPNKRFAAQYVWGLKPTMSVAQPRGGIFKAASYIPKPIVTRPGSQDAFEKPSREGDNFRPYKRGPISLAGGGL